MQTNHDVNDKKIWFKERLQYALIKSLCFKMFLSLESTVTPH